MTTELISDHIAPAPPKRETRDYLALRQWVRVRPDAYVCSIVDTYTGYEKLGSPLTGLILAMCNGQHTGDDIVQTLHRALKDDESSIRATVTATLDRHDEFLVRSRQPMPVSKAHDLATFVRRAPMTPPREPLRLTHPTQATLALTNLCNFRCIYCFKNSAKPFANELSEAEWLDVADQVVEAGVMRCNVTGGEPTMHPGFCSVVERFVEGGVFPYISTNGTTVTQKFAAWLRDLKLPVIQVSLDSAVPADHDFVTRAAGSHASVVAAIELLRDSGLAVRIKSVITPFNVRYVDHLVDLASRLGVDAITLDKFNPGFGGRGNSRLILTSRQTHAVEEAVEGAKARARSDMTVATALSPLRWRGPSDMVTCGGLLTAFAVQPNGDMGVCEQVAHVPALRVGNLRHETLRALWDSERAWEIVTPPPRADLAEPCGSCELLRVCRTGCFSHSLLYSHDPWSAEPSCWKVDLERNPVMPRAERSPS